MLRRCSSVVRRWGTERPSSFPARFTIFGSHWKHGGEALVGDDVQLRKIAAWRREGK
jgi:hypothetical protein